mgnify:CR=1 FL=1
MRFSAIVCTVLSHGWEGYVSLLPLTPAVQLGGAVGGWVCSLQGLCCRLCVHAQPKSCEHTEGLHCFIPQPLFTGSFDSQQLPGTAITYPHSRQR